MLAALCPGELAFPAGRMPTNRPKTHTTAKAPAGNETGAVTAAAYIGLGLDALGAMEGSSREVVFYIKT